MRRKFALPAAIAIAIGSSACTKIESRDLIREGNQLYVAGEFEAAIEKYDASLEREPDGVTVLWNRAMAAESIVLARKDSTEEADIAKRRKYADVALESLDEWNQRRDKVGPQDAGPECRTRTVDEDEEEEEDGDPDLRAYQEHRLAIWGADARCDDLIEHWRQMHQACPQNEDLYMTIAQTFEDTCGKPEKAQEWYVKRTEDFPDSAKAWYSLATRTFYPLMPDPDAGMPFNPAIEATKRIEIADEVIGLLAKATAIDPKYRDPYVWRSMAHTQKSLARQYVDPPETPEDAIEAIMARRDLMMAWRETKAVCDIDSIPECPADPDAGQLFVDLSTDPTVWAKQEINLSGKVVDETVKKVGDSIYEWSFDLEVPYTPVAAPGEEAPPPPAVGEDGEEAEDPTRIVKVRYTFLEPVAEEGEEPPDISEEIESTVDQWKRLKLALFSGVPSIEGDQVRLVAKQKPMIVCCPLAPLSPEDEKAETERLEQLRAELAAQQEGE